MKKRYSFLVLLLPLLFFISCTNKADNAKIITVKASDIIENSIHVNGMTCVGCEITLEEGISKIEGVVKVKASHKKDLAIISFDSTKTNTKVLKKQIELLGYKTFNNK